MIKKKRNIISILLILLFVGYEISAFSFTHTHIINGVTVVHSHPFTKDAESHNHGSSEISLINSILNSDIYDFTNITYYFICYDCILYQLIIQANISLTGPISKNLNPRGPPCIPEIIKSKID